MNYESLDWVIQFLSLSVSAKIGFCFPKGLGLDPGPVFRGCQLLYLKPTMAGGYTKVD